MFVYKQQCTAAQAGLCVGKDLVLVTKLRERQTWCDTFLGQKLCFLL